MFGFFARKASLINQIESLEDERNKLRDERDAAHSELTKFKATKQQEEEEIKHTLKMERERAEVERMKFEAKTEREKDEAVAKVKDQYRDKLEGELRNQIANASKMYEQILARLPDVNVRLKGALK